MMKRKTTVYKIGAFVLLALFLLEFALCFPLTAAAAEDGVYIDKTSIEEDFKSFGFDKTLYPKSPGAERQMIYFVESCYSEKFSGQDEFYGLYLWVYNPTCEAINEKGLNDLNLSVGGDVYDNLDLECLDATSDRLFYKFRVADTKITEVLASARAYAKEHEGERVYKIAGVQLQVGSDISHDSGIEKTFTFTGYAHGCGEGAEEKATLEMRTSGLETIHLTLNHTTWRSEGGTDNWHDAIHTVYFALPRKYLDQYGNLQKIKAEWDEYRTKEMLCTSDGEAYYRLSPYIAVNLPMDANAANLPQGLDEDLKCRVLWEETYMVYPSTTHIYYHRGFNDLKSGDTVGFWWLNLTHYADDYSFLPRLDWLFPLSSTSEKVSSKKIEAYMKDYTELRRGELAGGRYSKALFETDIDSDRKQYDPDGDHHIVQEIDADMKLDAVHVPGSFWDYIFGDGTTLVDDISPITVITDEAALSNMTVEDFEATYYVENDGGSSDNVLEDLKAIIDDEYCAVLFRFAVTDYYSCSAIFDLTDGWYDDITVTDPVVPNENGYVAKQTVFLNFDVISLSFKTADGGNVLTTIPVVADPIDVIPSLVPPPVNENLAWFELIVMLLLLLVMIAFLWPIVSPIVMGLFSLLWSGLVFILKALLKLVLWLLSLPFKLLGLLFRRR